MKAWIDSEDGLLAIETLQDVPEAAQVFSQYASKRLHEQERRILDMSVISPEKDRELVIEMSKLAGMKDMVNSFMGLLSKQKSAEHSRKKKREA